MKVHSRLILGAAVAWLAAGLGQGTTLPTPPAPGTALDRYLNGLKSLSATFTQTVTDAQGTQLGAGSGRLIVQRPGKFRWDYHPSTSANSQVLVADGKNLWFYDSELAQVTVKPVEAALSSTPIVLLSGSAAQLHDSFEVNGSAAHDGLDWVEVKPRSAEADFSHASLGFAGDKLARMIINDRLGQTVELDFPHSERNAHIDAGLLKFEPPKGVDVIGSAQN